MACGGVWHVLVQWRRILRLKDLRLRRAIKILLHLLHLRRRRVHFHLVSILSAETFMFRRLRRLHFLRITPWWGVLNSPRVLNRRSPSKPLLVLLDSQLSFGLLLLCFSLLLNL
jgi:hypothetical protein